MTGGVRRTVIQLLAAALLIVACTSMPWARYTNVSANVTTTFRGGPLSALLVVFAVVSIGVSLTLLVRKSMSLKRFHVALGGAAVIVSILLALTKISSANHMGIAQGGETSYGFGAAIGILATGAIALTSFIALVYVDAAPDAEPRTAELREM